MQSKEEQDKGIRGKTRAESSHFHIEPQEYAQTRSAGGNCAAGSGVAVDEELARKRATTSSNEGARVRSTDSSSHNSVDALLRRIAKQANDRRRHTDRDVSDSSRYATTPTTTLTTDSRHRRQSSSQEERLERTQSRRRHNSNRSRWDNSSSSSGGGRARSSREETPRSTFSGAGEGGQNMWERHQRGGGVESAGGGDDGAKVHGASTFLGNGQQHDARGRVKDRAAASSSATAMSAAQTNPFTEGMCCLLYTSPSPRD